MQTRGDLSRLFISASVWLVGILPVSLFPIPLYLSVYGLGFRSGFLSVDFFPFGTFFLICDGLEAQQAEPATLGLAFDDRMQRLVDYIYQEKYNAKIQRLIRSAKLRFPQADMQGILYEGRG